jgi:hypothetical protein
MANPDAKSSRPDTPNPPPLARSVSSPGRWAKGALLFRDETLQKLATLLDDAFRVPFTGVRFGIDGIIGLVPGLGDVIGGILSLAIPVAAWSRGIPYITILRMGANLAIDVLIGTIPILGDAFDIAWKSNRRNYNLLKRHLAQPRRHTWKDWLFLAALLIILILVFAIPIVVLAWLLIQLNQRVTI